MKDALKLALEALESAKELAGKHDSELEYGFQHTITVIKEALAQPEQEVDWKDQYEKQKRRAEMWMTKYEEVAGPAPCAVPLAQPDYRAVKTYHEGKPVYVSQPEQEPVAGDVHTEHCFQGEYKHCCKYGDGDDCTAAPKRPWVSLTDDETKEQIKHSDLLDMFEHIGWYSAPRKGFDKNAILLIQAIEATLKEKNT